jgi:hypothetical protein
MSRKGNIKGAPPAESLKQDQRASLQQNIQQNNPSLDRAGSRLGDSNGNGNASAPDSQIFSSDEIAERAYQIFEREGRMDGRDMEHWLQAERELRMEREKRKGQGAGESRGQGRGEMNAQNAPRSARQHQPQG